MATFRLGSSCSSRGIASVPEQHYDVLEHGEEDAADPNKLLQCPYDKNHQIRASRFPYHIIKCRKNHPKLASELKTCPFNAKHLIAPHEFSHHIANCVNKQAVSADNSGSADMQRKWHVPVSTWTNPDSGEDWEKESEEMPETPFVWGVSNCQPDSKRPLPAPSDKPVGLRAPRTLPWQM
ncbi:gametocyte-specific factor 1 isoform X2 [Brienomyrus brachyistius]|nr:gametocyte-specific factor 1 isoform X2 [Brienomyrus brachyistius]XP_048872110.1 gametocyte-specific factor 1 isoform X2 [Brienomyrus brachyistius]XP_048872111.1 gametocyte-specific factor 1 isoform X2 [Brienomyrus brachyistius]XP_048872112.1 gametocyte-specific factor 1 isoform X2 [Brienomyrus brachyistius]XP_048872113.1 gametocyte-specific factor 1 isoform X2 [Brienomyrus brachyistius]